MMDSQANSFCPKHNSFLGEVARQGGNNVIKQQAAPTVFGTFVQRE